MTTTACVYPRRRVQIKRDIGVCTVLPLLEDKFFVRAGMTAAAHRRGNLHARSVNRIIRVCRMHSRRTVASLALHSRQLGGLVLVPRRGGIACRMAGQAGGIF